MTHLIPLPDSDVEDLTDRDLDHQFDHVKRNTPNSPVCRYGDMSYTDFKVIEFQGVAGSQQKKAASAKISNREDRVLAYEVSNLHFFCCCLDVRPMEG